MAGLCRHRTLEKLEYAHVHEILGSDRTDWPCWFLAAWDRGQLVLGPGPKRVTVHNMATYQQSVAEYDDILVHSNSQIMKYTQTEFDQMYEVLP